MAVAFRASALLGDEGTGQTASISGTIPSSAQIGDTALLAVVQATGVNTFTTPAGWTLLSGPDRLNTNITTAVWGRKLAAGDPGKTVTVNANGGARFVGVLSVYSGAAAPADVVVSDPAPFATAATTITSPNVQAPAAGCAIAAFWAVRSNTVTPPTVTAPGTHTADGESNTANAAAPNFALRASHRTALTSGSGTYGGSSATVSQAATALVYSVALPPAGGNTAPTADAGPNQTGVEPWSKVTLTGTDSDPDGTVVARSWAQTAGPTVTLAGSGATRTFTAPPTLAGATLTFAYTVTDNGGATGTGTMSVTVLPVPERTMAGGAWQPAKVTLAPAGPPPPTPPPTPGEPEPPEEPGPGAGLPDKPQVGHAWTMWSRTPSYALDEALPIVSAKFVRRHMGVSTAVAETPFTPARWTSLQPSCGIVLYRDGRQEFTGRVTARQVDWDAENGRAVIKVEAKGDSVLLEDRLVFPDPSRAPDNQTVNDYWTTSGVPASTAMLRLITDQAGTAAHADRRIPGLVLGDDPGVGVIRAWKALFLPVLDQLQLMSIGSGANLGLRMVSEAGSLEVSVYQPRNLAAAIKFSADLSNLVGFTYREEAPTLTDAVAAGQGDLHLRLRKWAKTGSALALAWGRRIWTYVDRRDTADVAELNQAALDAVTEGDATVSLAVTLTDSQAATYGRDWGLGDRITVYVGLPGQTKVATVSDVCREIEFEVSEDGRERITPAIGSYDATAVIPTPTQRQLAAVGVGLSGLIARK